MGNGDDRGYKMAQQDNIPFLNALKSTGYGSGGGKGLRRRSLSGDWFSTSFALNAHCIFRCEIVPHFGMAFCLLFFTLKNRCLFGCEKNFKIGTNQTELRPKS